MDIAPNSRERTTRQIGSNTTYALFADDGVDAMNTESATAAILEYPIEISPANPIAGLFGAVRVTSGTSLESAPLDGYTTVVETAGLSCTSRRAPMRHWQFSYQQRGHMCATTESLVLRSSTMSKLVKDIFGIAPLVAAAALFIGVHSWMFVQ
jgi:hypothetical protein